MIKQVAHPTISEIFSINNIVYRISKYQREYTWGINDWNALFNDVTENDFGYFLGSYICVNSGSINGTTLEMIDGPVSSIMFLIHSIMDIFCLHPDGVTAIPLYRWILPSQPQSF